MTKEQFVAELEQQLQDISYDERQAALRYYEEYFDEAGQDSEVVNQLESPEEIARAIKEDLDIKLQMVRNSVERKTMDSGEKSTDSTNGADFQKKGKKRNQTIKIIAIVILCVLCSPLIFGALGGVFGVLMGIIGCLIGFSLAGIGLCIAGIAVLATGFLTLGTLPLFGILQMGVSFLLLGLGLLFILAAVWFWSVVFPAFIRWLQGLIQKIRGKEAKA